MGVHNSYINNGIISSETGPHQKAISSKLAVWGNLE